MIFTMFVDLRDQMEIKLRSSHPPAMKRTISLVSYSSIDEESGTVVAPSEDNEGGSKVGREEVEFIYDLAVSSLKRMGRKKKRSKTADTLPVQKLQVNFFTRKFNKKFKKRTSKILASRLIFAHPGICNLDKHRCLQ